MTHVKVDDWGEPVKLGPQEWDFEVEMLGAIPVRVSYWRGKLVGIEWWKRSSDPCDAGTHNAIIDPEKPWLK